MTRILPLAGREVEVFCMMVGMFKYVIAFVVYFYYLLVLLIMHSYILLNLTFIGVTCVVWVYTYSLKFQDWKTALLIVDDVLELVQNVLSIFLNNFCIKIA